jgi:hypothetical protein
MVELAVQLAVYFISLACKPSSQPNKQEVQDEQGGIEEFRETGRSSGIPQGSGRSAHDRRCDGWSRDFRAGLEMVNLRPAHRQDEKLRSPAFQYHVSGVLMVLMDDGTELECKPGDVSLLPSGHDAWVVGNEPAVIVDFQGMIDYAKSR